MRVSVPLRQAYKLINHGPTTLITSASGGRANVMAAAWVVPLDIDPPKLALVISSDTFTRALVEQSGELVVNLPTVAMAAQTIRAGKVAGHERDKLAALGFATSPASRVAAPLVEGCVAWLECRVRDEPAMRERYDLVLADVVAAWADDAVWRDSGWHFDGHPEKRTLHHVSKGTFFAIGEPIVVPPEGAGG